MQNFNQNSTLEISSDDLKKLCNTALILIRLKQRAISKEFNSKPEKKYFFNFIKNKNARFKYLNELNELELEISYIKNIIMLLAYSDKINICFSDFIKIIKWIKRK